MAVYDIVYPLKKAVRNLYAPETDDSGMCMVFDGTEELVFKTTINLSTLQDMARRATANKKGKSTAGPITVEILSRKRL